MHVWLSLLALDLLSVTTDTRSRYLEALGFRPAETQSSPSLLGDAPSKENQKNLAETPHVTWLSSDGEWERVNLGMSLADPASPYCGHPQTLAGTVAQIDNASELDAVWTRYKLHPGQEDRDQLIV